MFVLSKFVQGSKKKKGIKDKMKKRREKRKEKRF
jgi:hypothetical protein